MRSALAFARSEKPPYRVPSMAEVRALSGTNGLVVASLFAGCGGSSTGYRMAGFRVAWASEFVDAAADSYSANYPETPVDRRDVRELRPEEVLEAIGLRQGELDVLDGSPPCASFSTAGKREKGWGLVKRYSDVEQRTDDLFAEYARIVEGVRPKAFVAENVAGFVKGAARGYFVEAVRRLEAADYVVRAKVLDASRLGVPQVRRRTIIIGVRKDLGKGPRFPDPLPYVYSVRDALPHVARAVHDTKGMMGKKRIDDSPSPPINVGSGRNFTHWKVEREASIERFAIGREWAKLRPGEQSDRYFSLVRPDPDKALPTVTAIGGNLGAAGVTHPYAPRKFTIDELKALCSFPSDYALTGTYGQQWERCGRAVPPLMMKAIAAELARSVFGVAASSRT